MVQGCFIPIQIHGPGKMTKPEELRRFRMSDLGKKRSSKEGNYFDLRASD